MQVQLLDVDAILVHVQTTTCALNR